MAKNDVILIDNIIQERVNEGMPSSNSGEVFEYLSSEQILKDYDLAKEDILSGIVDGRDDGGIDSFYIFVNGTLLTDLESFSWPRKSCEISLYLITSRHRDTFEQEVVNNEYASVSELFDLGLDNSELKGSYNADVLFKRRLFIDAYKKTATSLSKLSFYFYYVSRGDASIVGENIRSRANQIESSLKGLFSNCIVEYSFLGSSELLSLYRKKPEYELELRHSGIISYSQECFIVLCNLKDYYSFITDESGKLKKYLFDSNVRDYLGANSVNDDIMMSLKNNDADFWWLNNGITILARHAVNIGNALKIQDVQIVNGLQTSQTVFDFYSVNSIPSESRSVMIKVISQSDAEIRDKIIRSTNNQSAIESKSLFATDKIQRDIEDVMKHSGFYYERRTNYYKNQDVDPSMIFDIMGLGAGYLGLIFRAPERAANFKQKILRDTMKYNLLFNHGDPLEIWPFIANLIKRIDKAILATAQSVKGSTEKLLKRSRYVAGVLVLGRSTGTYNYSVPQILRLKEADIPDSVIAESSQFVVDRYVKELMLTRMYMKTILKEASGLYGIDDFESFSKRKNIFIVEPDYYIPRKRRVKLPPVQEDDIRRVKNALPPQPWPRGTSARIADELQINYLVVQQAIDVLIDRCDVYVQRYGVLYDKEGNVVG